MSTRTEIETLYESDTYECHRNCGETREKLVLGFEISVPIAFAYYLVHAERVSRLPRVLAFREWIYEQVHRA